MNPLASALFATLLIIATGGVALFLRRAPGPASLIAAGGAAIGGAFGLWPACVALVLGKTGELAANWHVPGGTLILGIDPLSAFFLMPLFALGAACAVYGRSYLGSQPLAAAALNFLIGSSALILLARHAVVFLIAWETMALLTYLLVAYEHNDREARRAGWVYLVAAHVAMIALIGLFLGLGARSGGELDFTTFAREGKLRAEAAGTVALLWLALVGFGIKAGVFGLHVWLPEAHAAAPSHVSALMSGVVIKLGLYGLLRTVLLLPPGAWFGITLMIAGATGAVLGIVLALYQRDLKRILAYSSVENIGIILLGIGLGLWARSHGDAALSALAFSAALLHLWNHAAMKGLMFLGAGSVVHGAGGKDIERLGGLLRRMPWTSRAMILGAVAMSALPPLNGFISEWLLYRALARVAVHGAGGPGLAAIAGAGALALIGGLGALCFVRLIGVVLLGTPRAQEAAVAHESPRAMLAPMMLLAGACVASAFAAPVLVSIQTPLLVRLAGASATDVNAAMQLLSPVLVVNAVLFAAITLMALFFRSRAALRRAQLRETWGCGYANPSARMQYTGGAFSELLSAGVLPRWLRGQQRLHAPAGLFPPAASFSSYASDPMTQLIYEPFLARWAQRFVRLRVLQQGNVQVYILYVVAAAVLGFAWIVCRDWLLQ